MRIKNSQVPVTTPIKVLSPSARIGIAVAAAAVMMLAAGLVYIWVILPAIVGNPIKPIKGDAALRIVAASRIYADSLQARGQPVPASAPLSDLVNAGLLRPKDMSAFEGLDATIALHTNGTVFSPQTVLMRVQLRDGSQIILFADGSVQTVAPTASFRTN